MNERGVGEGIRRSGLDRSEVFIETKVWITDYGYEQALHAFDKAAALAALAHAQVAAANTTSLISGSPDLASYSPQPPGISVPLGPAGGASYAPHAGILDAARTGQIKVADLMIPTFRQLLGLEEPVGQEAAR
jgi:hypothetical protein